MSDDDLTPEEAGMLRQLIVDLGTIDARMRVLQATLLRYPDLRLHVPRSYWSGLLSDACDVVQDWQALAASPGGALFDPRVIGPDTQEDDHDQ